MQKHVCLYILRYLIHTVYKVAILYFAPSLVRKERVLLHHCPIIVAAIFNWNGCCNETRENPTAFNSLK